MHKYLLHATALLGLTACAGTSEPPSNEPTSSIASGPVASSSAVAISSSSPVRSSSASSSAPSSIDQQSSSSQQSSHNSSSNNSSADNPFLTDKKVGFFLDSQVHNLGYRTATIINGRTNQDGRYQYDEGEAITFNIGAITMTATGKAIMTPMDLVGSTDNNNQALRNLVRFFVTLDSDGNPNNGIRIPEQAHINASQAINFAVSKTDFENSPTVSNLIANLGNAQTVLVSEDSAMAHFAETQKNDLYQRVIVSANETNGMSGNTLFNQGFGGTAVEDQRGCDGIPAHTGVEHLRQVYDSEYGEPVFAFDSHINHDADCAADRADRQRLEVKTYNSSGSHVKGAENEWHTYRWSMKLPEGFQTSSRFTHLFQIKGVDGDVKTPTITITATTQSGGQELQIRYVANGGDKIQYFDRTALSQFLGKWIDIDVRIHYSNQGYFELSLREHATGTVIVSVFENNIDMFREGASFMRPKWGIYRSLENGADADLRDETVYFADFCIGEGTNVCTQANDHLSNTQPPEDTGTMLLHQYSFDGNSNDNLGTLNLSGSGSPSFNATGISGKAATFNGKNYVKADDVNSFGFQRESSFAIAMWIKFNALPSANPDEKDTYLLEQFNSSGEDQGGFRLMARRSNDRLRLRLRDAEGEQTDLDSQTVISMGQWYHLAANYNQGTMRLFINGTEEASTSFAGVANNISPIQGDRFTIGGISTSTQQGIIGQIDEVNIFKNALSEQQIKNLFENP